MAEKICIWFAILTCAVPALMCVLAALACFWDGQFVIGILVGWLGCWLTACTAFVWWCKKKSEEYDMEVK